MARTVDVHAGCVHRLSSPIGPLTRFPCPACAALGFPGLWAIAMLVDERWERRRALQRLKASVVTDTAVPRNTIILGPPLPTIMGMLARGDLDTFARQVRAIRLTE